MFDAIKTVIGVVFGLALMLAGWLCIAFGVYILYDIQFGSQTQAAGDVFVNTVAGGSILVGVAISYFQTSQWIAEPTFGYLTTSPAAKRVLAPVGAALSFVLRFADVAFHAVFFFALLGFIIGLFEHDLSRAAALGASTAMVTALLACLFVTVARVGLTYVLLERLATAEDWRAAWTGLPTSLHQGVTAELGAGLSGMALTAAPYVLIVGMLIYAIASFFADKRVPEEVYDPQLGVHHTRSAWVRDSAEFSGLIGRLLGFAALGATIYLLIKFFFWVLGGVAALVLEWILSVAAPKRTLISAWLLRHGWPVGLIGLGVFAAAYVASRAPAG